MDKSLVSLCRKSTVNVNLEVSIESKHIIPNNACSSKDPINSALSTSDGSIQEPAESIKGVLSVRNPRIAPFDVKTLPVTIEVNTPVKDESPIKKSMEICAPPLPIE
jgi:hypothetical protein